MSTETKAFVHEGDWSAETRRHPALKWFEPVVRDIFDAHLWDTPYSEIYTDDLTLLKPDGTEVKGGKEAWAQVAQLYGPFTEQRTQPFYAVVTETEYVVLSFHGLVWRRISIFNLYPQTDIL
jgi:hypothetical protein